MITEGTAGGSRPHASVASFPAGATTLTPASTSWRSASSSVGESPAVTPTSATAGDAWFSRTQSRAATSEDTDPVPLQSSARIE